MRLIKVDVVKLSAPDRFGAISYKEKRTPKCSFGAGGVIRTRDLFITSEMHYLLCYTSEF